MSPPTRLCIALHGPATVYVGSVPFCDQCLKLVGHMFRPEELKRAPVFTTAPHKELRGQTQFLAYLDDATFFG